MGTLYYGDNLDIIRRHMKDGTVDLVYLDPPFNSAQTYNAFFQEKDGTAAASQISAFEDTWHWDIDTKRSYDAVTEQPGKVSDVMQAFYTFLGGNDMMAYLTMMAPRLVELRRVLKPTGSLYLHCDPTASHYLKLLCDAIMGKDNFRSEIIWKRTSAHSNATQNYAAVHDVIFFYSQSTAPTWNRMYEEYDPEYVAEHFVHQDPDGRRFRRVDLVNPASRPNLVYEYKGYKPHPNGWKITKEKMEQLDREGRLFFPKKGTEGRIRRKLYLDESLGVPVSDVWPDIKPIHATAAERLGYPTQKPLELLERIIRASSNPGDLVLDPFCGCGTTIDAAEKLGRQWIGIDITQLATSLIKHRLRDTYGEKIEIKTIGEPTTPNEATTLAEEDKYQFQWWALGLVGARPVEQKKGADHGIDGKILFRDDPRSPKPEQIIIQVKGGKTGVKDVRDLRGVLDREKAAIGVLISLQPPTDPMETEAASAGFYEHKMNRQKFPRLQLRTVKELMEGKGIERPSTIAATDETFKKAPQAKARGDDQSDLGLG